MYSKNTFRQGVCNDGGSHVETSSICVVPLLWALYRLVSSITWGIQVQPLFYKKLTLVGQLTATFVQKFLVCSHERYNRPLIDKHAHYMKCKVYDNSSNFSSTYQFSFPQLSCNVASFWRKEYTISRNSFALVVFLFQ